MLGRAGWGSGGQCQGGAQLECKVWTRHEWPHSRSQPSYATTASPRGGDKQLWRAAGDSLLVCVHHSARGLRWTEGKPRCPRLWQVLPWLGVTSPSGLRPSDSVTP